MKVQKYPENKKALLREQKYPMRTKVFWEPQRYSEGTKIPQAYESTLGEQPR